MRNRCLPYAWLSIWLIFVAGCAELPEYAKPRTLQNEDLYRGVSSGFTYRQLKREDFRATSLPGNMSPHSKNINAQSAITIRVTADSQFSMTPRPFPDRIHYVGGIHHLAFEAVMLPDNSWWNPKLKEALAGYVLQHEQVHFALTEIAARKLTRDVQKKASSFSVTRESPQEVYSEIARQVKEMINSAMEENKKRHLKFDEDTSLFYNPSWQAWWLETVEKELSQAALSAQDH